MKKFNVTLVMGHIPIKTWFQYGETENEVYWNVREEYPVEIHGNRLIIEVKEVH